MRLLSGSVTVIPASSATDAAFSVKARLATVAVTVGRPFTLTVALFALSAPCQLVAKTGVTVYLYDPSGTLLSTHVSAVIVPAQADRIVCGVSVLASYLLTR